MLPGCKSIEASVKPSKAADTEERSSLVINRVNGFNGTVHIGTRQYYKNEDVSTAMFLFYDAWLSTFGDKDKKVLTALQNLTIIWEEDHWVVEDALIYSENGKQAETTDVLVMGLAQHKNLIIVSARYKELERSSLVHELIHVAIWHTNQESEGDADHLGDKFPGWTRKHSALLSLVNVTLAIVIED